MKIPLLKMMPTSKMLKSKKAEEISFGMTEMMRWGLIIIAIIIITIILIHFGPQLSKAVEDMF